MIAAAGLRRYRQGVRAGWDLNADASLPLECGLGTSGTGPRTPVPGP